jgi:hypothetical protein
MPVRRIEPILAEIIAALDGISAATAGKTLDDFRDDWLLRHGVERGIEIISEATRQHPGRFDRSCSRNSLEAGSWNRQHFASRISQDFRRYRLDRSDRQSAAATPSCRAHPRGIAAQVTAAATAILAVVLMRLAKPTAHRSAAIQNTACEMQSV